MKPLQLVVFDMAGTTVQDDHVVESCFYKAAVNSGLAVSKDQIKAMQGLPKLTVVQLLWKEQLPETDPQFQLKVTSTYENFREILENYYESTAINPTKGALSTFEWLHQRGIQIALTTGFYRKVANIILKKLGWYEGLNEKYLGGAQSLIQLSLTPDETGKGRPYPDMIYKAMELLNVEDPKTVIKIGDTPADLEAGRRANVLYSLAVTNGTHSLEDLKAYPNDGLLSSLEELPSFLEAVINDK